MHKMTIVGLQEELNDIAQEFKLYTITVRVGLAATDTWILATIKHEGKETVVSSHGDSWPEMISGIRARLHQAWAALGGIPIVRTMEALPPLVVPGTPMEDEIPELPENILEEATFHEDAGEGIAVTKADDLRSVTDDIELAAEERDEIPF